ncbi:uncharacterized protein M6B38_283920 [Iris pallida]|uniref:Mal d 1-associated protein n=1 Tax=Iris pallida TaxID=29817 RepID=A0AAX6I297_IRIPA|nr:uncharacterized protein M6B38_283920 [Iris pallida]
MGWKWEDDEPSKGLGDLLNPNPNSTGRRREEGSMEEENCSTRRIVKSSCRTEEVELGKFIRKCQKTEQTLRNCFGRPPEVVESKTEHTEEDVTDEVTSGSLPLDLPGGGLFSFPGLRNDMEDIERGLFGSLGHLLETAEEMANEFFQSFNISSPRNRESSRFSRLPTFEQHEEESSKKMEESTYSGLPGEVRDV